MPLDTRGDFFRLPTVLRVDFHTESAYARLIRILYSPPGPVPQGQTGGSAYALAVALWWLRRKYQTNNYRLRPQGAT